MAKVPIRVYAETSVFGGVFDGEFEQASREFFAQVHRGRFRLVVSAAVRDELDAAPTAVKHLFRSWTGAAEMAQVTEAAVDLRKAYISAGIVGPRSITDALHVAIATVTGCTMIVSWNFSHIVHFDKIPLYNAVNTLRGFGRIAIYSPREVIAYEDQDL